MAKKSNSLTSVSIWKKKGKGNEYRGHYLRDNNGERVMCLTGYMPNGKIHTVTAESWQMFKTLGWVKIQ